MGDLSLIGRPTFGGLATGLDTSALIDGLLALERQPLNRIRARRAEIDAQRGLMRELNTKLLALRTAAQEIDNRNATGTGFATSEELLRFSGSSTNDDVVTVSAGAGAAPGEIDVLVNQLARGSRRFSETFTAAAAETALTAGQSITIDLPNADPDASPPVEATSLTVTAEGDLSLQDLRDQINTSADNGGAIRADILRLGPDAFELVLTSTGSGLQNELSVSGDIAIQPPAPEDVARDAEIVLFGRTITRSSNTIDDALAGITLQLNGLSEIDEAAGLDANGNPIRTLETLSVEIDVDEVAASLEKLARAYNDVVGFIQRQSVVDENTNRSGPLSGDSTLRSIQSELRDVVSRGYRFSRNPNNPFAAGDQGGSISGIGLELEAGGTLRVDKEKLGEALAKDPLSVREFLSGRLGDGVDESGNPIEVLDPGFAQTLAARLEEIVRSGDGTLAERDQGFARRLETFDDSIARFEQRLGQREETLIQRFSALESVVAGLQNQQGFLSGLGR